MKTSVKVTGFKQVTLNLEDLEKKITRGAMRIAIGKAGKLVAGVARAKAPVGRTGLLKKSIRTKVSTNTRKQMVTVRIGPSNKVKGTDPLTGKVVRPAKYAHLVEFGTASRGVWGKKGLAVTPGNAPQPFMRPAHEATKSEVESKFKAEMGPAIEKTAARIKKSQLKKIA